jgi:hypothetical protein
VKGIQKRGIEVQGGFIVGFDEDPPTIFQRMSEFVHESAIVTAMVGLLNAPTGTRLHERLLRENRLLYDFNGNNTDLATNFVPRMGIDALLEGYRSVLDALYSPAGYYARVRKFLTDFEPQKSVARIDVNGLLALGRSMIVLGVVGRERVHYWKLFLWSLFQKPRLFPLAIRFAIYGHHFRRISLAAS